MRADVEGVENLVEHHPVLSRYTHSGFETIHTGLELLYQRRHLHRLRPGTKNHQDFAHTTVS